jgi:hypothetical protein
MPPVRRHRIGDQLTAVVHLDPAAIALCRDLAAEIGVEAIVLFGSRANGSWDEQSDLDMIVVHGRRRQRGREEGHRRNPVGLKGLHYPGYRDRENTHHGVQDGQMQKTRDSPAKKISGTGVQYRRLIRPQ